MRKITSTILVALLTFSVGFGTVAAKPRGERPGNGNGAITIPFKVNETHNDAEWRCTGNYVKNKNRTRVHAECNVSSLASLPVGPGSYSSATHDISDYVDTYADDAQGITGLPVLEEDLQNWVWSVEITDNGDGTAHVSGVAVNEGNRD